MNRSARFSRHRRGSAYRGRLLPRPDEEVVDQGLGFDLGTLLDRRRVLAVLGGGAAGAALAACSVDPLTPGTSGSATAVPTGPASGGTTEIPDETAGPFPGDGSNGPDVLARSRGPARWPGRASSGATSGAAWAPGRRRPTGVPLLIELSVLDLAKAGAAFAGVAVYVWHCDANGNDSMYPPGWRTRTICVASSWPTRTAWCASLDLSGRVLGPLAARPLRNPSGRDLDRRRRPGDRDLPARVPRETCERRRRCPPAGHHERGHDPWRTARRPHRLVDPPFGRPAGPDVTDGAEWTVIRQDGREPDRC